MRRVTAVLFAIALGVVVFSPTQVSAAVGGCAGGEDYNGDGFADTAIGVPEEDIGAVSNAGAVQVIYGGSGGVTSAADQVFHQDSDGMNDTAEEFDHFGAALASGDFDNDGFDDLAVGVPGEGIGEIDTAGSVHIIYGTASGLSSSGDQVFHRETADINEDADSFDQFGAAVAACDFNNNGRDDLAVGVPFDEVGSGFLAGSVNVIYGSASGLNAAGDQVFHQDVLNDAAEDFDRFGEALATGDFNADGRGDLAVGVPGESIESLELFEVGAVQIIYGSASGLSDAGNQFFNQDSPGINETAENGDSFGFAVASGDFDGDGFDDLSIGVPFEDIGGTIPDAGAIQIIYGSAGGLSPAGGDQVFHQEIANMNDTSEEGDLFGYALASGDFDDDGFDDVAVGVPEEFSNGDGQGIEINFCCYGSGGEGVVHIIYGTGAGLSAAGDQVFHQDTPGMNDTADQGDSFGRALTSGDYDADGFDDLAVGVPFEDITNSDEGEVQIVYGTSAGLSSAGDQIFHQDTAGMNDTAEPGDVFGGALVGSPYRLAFIT
jgi:hypothetical protein